MHYPMVESQINGSEAKNYVWPCALPQFTADLAPYRHLNLTDLANQMVTTPRPKPNTISTLHSHGRRRRHGGVRGTGALPLLQERQDRAPSPASHPPSRSRRGHRRHVQGRRPRRGHRPLRAPLPSQAPGPFREAPGPRLLPRRLLPHRVGRLLHVPQLRQRPRRGGRRPRRVRRLPPGPGAPAPRCLRRLLGRAPVGGVGAGRLDPRARRHGPPVPRRRQRGGQHRPRHAHEGGFQPQQPEGGGRDTAAPVVRRDQAGRGGAPGRVHGHRDALVLRVPGRGGRRRRPEDQPAGAGRAGAGEARLREDARDRRAGGRARRAEPRVPRRRGQQRVGRHRGVARVRWGGSRVLPREARVRQRQAAHGPRRRLHSRCLIESWSADHLHCLREEPALHHCLFAYWVNKVQ
ncbi:hypothetical protein D1007_58660 [Hordeum vulgare]|nr:hypothetical protein D1007_58660 [Hordeum vulgare]